MTSKPHYLSMVVLQYVTGSMLSNAELHRMVELDKIAAMGTADEQILHR